MAKFITFNGTTLIHPGGLTKVDADAMSQVGAGISGVVGVIGEAVQGQPYDPATAALAGEEPKVYEFTNPESMADTFGTGELADAVDFLFNPSNDIRIPGGVQRVIALKSNRDTQSSAALPDLDSTAVSCVFTSNTYGANANSVSASLAVNGSHGNTIDLSVTDGNTNTTETFTGICGDQLMDVQYAPSAPAVVLETGDANKTNIIGAVSGLTLKWADIVATFGATLTANNEGQYVQITKCPSQPLLIGQVRRIATGGYSAVTDDITMENPFFNATGTAIQVPVDTEFKIIRAAIGPFFVKTYDAATGAITTSGRNATADQPSSFTVGSPTFHTATVTALGRYGDPQNGPCYVHIISGAGGGQIRRIADPGVTAIADEHNVITLTTPFAVSPAANSQFVLINAVPRNLDAPGTLDAPTATGGTETGEGAYGVINGTLGVAENLRLALRPGWGEPTTAVTTTVDLDQAGTLVNTLTQLIIGLSANLNIQALVNSINLGTMDGSPFGTAVAAVQVDTGYEVGQWKARVGPGRNGALPSDRFDFGLADARNNAMPSLPDATSSDGVDCLCDFASTSPAANGRYNSVPKRWHSFVDNVALLADTINGQSALITAARATAVGTPAGSNWGDGVPAMPATYPLSGGAYNATTASGLEECFDELIKRRHNTSVALWSTDTANFTIDFVHGLLQTSAKRGAGSYRNEIDCIAAFQPQGATSADLATIKNHALTLNDRNVALVFQDIKRPGLNGLVNQYAPHMLACAIAGMQSGSTIGTPLTYKLVRANKILCKNTTIDVLDKTTSDDLLLSGILFAEFVKNKGYRVVRNLSTYVATDNVAYTDRNVNYELNFMAYDLRTFIEERYIGIKGTPATVASIKSSVISKLDYYKNGVEIIVDSNDLTTGAVLNAYRNLKITISGDICTIRFEIFPAVGINYITFTIFAQLPTLSA